MIRFCHFLLKHTLTDRAWRRWVLWRAKRERRVRMHGYDGFSWWEDGPVTEDTSMPVNLAPTVIRNGARRNPHIAERR